jgi:imidazolonepropionase-like amidohydrolase
MWNVLSAGVDCIEHAVFLDDQATLGYDAPLADAIARAGLFVSPTLQEAFRGLAALDAPDRLTEPSERQTLEALRERKWGNIRNAGRLHEAGVRLIAGSDAGSRVTPHGDLAFGVELLARAGLTTAEALHAATGLAADACGIAADVGTLQPGRIADLLIVEGDVTADIRAVANVRAVFQAGRLAAERTS